jgi:RecA-family ATPase
MYDSKQFNIKNPGHLDIKGVGESSVFVDNWTMIDGSLISNDYDILIVDNLYTSTEKDVQNNQELAKLLSKIASIKNKYDIGIMLINHHTKMNQDTKTLNKDMIRGGKSFTDFVSNAIQVAQSNLSHDLKIFKLTKCRSQQADILNVPFCMEFDDNTLAFERLNAIENESVHYVDIKKKPEFQAFKHLKAYATETTINSKKYPGVLNIEQIKTYVESELGRNPKTTYAWINRLIEYGLFERVAHGHYQIKNYKYLDDT